MSFEAATNSAQASVQQGMASTGATGPGSPTVPTQNNTQSNFSSQQSTQSNVDPVTGQQMSNSQSADADQKAMQEILDLDGVAKLKYQGEELTPEQLSKRMMMEKDYRKKTAEVAREREYSANLKADLAKVKRDPALADEFRRLYPEKFHDYLDLVLEQAAAQEAKDNTQSQQADLSPAVAKQIQDLQKRLDHYERGIGEKEHAAKVQTIQAELDTLFKGYEKKYDFAIEESVLTKAEALIAKGYQMTPAAWERLWKASHEQNMSKAQKWSESRTKAQLQANQEGGDIGRGGGTPSAGRRKMSLSDATEHMISQLSKG